MAVASATQDYRFSPVTKNELSDIDIEISVLSPNNGRPDIPFVELGFPSTNYHVLFPTPYMGVGGALALAQRIINLIR